MATPLQANVTKLGLSINPSEAHQPNGDDET